MAYLLKPFNNGKINLKNRLVMPPMATAKAYNDGRISQDILNYYDEKSKGGYISLIIIEHSFISEDGKASLNQLSIADDSLINDLKKLSKIIHKNGSKAVMQINHAGSLARNEVNENPVGPSAILNPRKLTGIMPRELTKDEIKEIINSFKKSASRVKEAGFDGVEIHSAHSYLLNQFISPMTNKRNDEYGGNIQGRIKIHLEVIKAVREAVGEEFPVVIRLGATDDNTVGLTLDDAVEAALSFEKAGVDMVDISGGMCGYILQNSNEQGYFSTQSYEIKKAVKIPVILTGGVTDPVSAERLLEDEKADFIGVGRAILKDSLWAKNAVEKLRN
ncbi:NADH:flavin oxidoreductase [Sedimentibacter sp. MB31-C6]|uniref:NADH:flavin oxidoreductase n=1 Tax=Sedimentibacter sp. MB31-C6 TaxID=3109366 RepID=UPI002DDD081D|nr:NADH:flavin oxidoreductase [Sedimentibacter sp. MB36-C1]WSI03628.1 NADH:flavin oxidoreductase [Sedimentibacter sp. MB36-C1]